MSGDSMMVEMMREQLDANPKIALAYGADHLFRKRVTLLTGVCAHVVDAGLSIGMPESALRALMMETLARIVSDAVKSKTEGTP